MFKVEQCNGLDCNVYYKPLQKVSKISVRNNKIRSLYTSDYRDRLMRLFTYKIQDIKIKNAIHDFIINEHNLKDKEIYDGLINILNGYNVSDDSKRGEYRINTINKYINDWNNITPTFYLDIGCFQGDITKSIGSHFNLGKFQIHGIDIKQYVDTDEFIYTVYDGKHIPYNNESFDLITCFMVLHHIPPNNIKTLIEEIYRVMKPGGLLLLREHNASSNDYFLLDVLHEYYDYVLNSEHKWEESQGYYNSTNYWATLICDAGFEYNTVPNIRKNNPKNPFNNYMASFKKPLRLAAQRDFFRVLTPEFPREQYTRRYKDRRDYIHWGQRKLLLSEIEFLCMFYQEMDIKHTESKNIIVVYAGAAPGTHILILNELFPRIHFLLYDPAPFSNELYDVEMIEVHQELFTNDVCNALKERFSNENTILLFISDIRTADISTMNSEEVEEHVASDQQLQLDWYNILEPDLSMLKFRLPWDNNYTDYLDGAIYIQAYAPLSSTETRLIIKKNASIKPYDNRLYEEQMFYFNKYMRDSEYCIEGELLPYDRAVERYLLLEYSKLNDSFSTPLNANIDDKVLYNFSDHISRTLSESRTLTSAQPLAHHKKIMIKKLIAAGLVPPNIQYTTQDYNLYVLPIYDKVTALGL